MKFARSSMPPAQRRRLRTAVIATTVAVPLAACSVGGTDSGSGAEDDVLRIAAPQEPPTIDPCEAVQTATGSVVRSNITQPLLERSPEDSELQPVLATEWTATSDTEWTFTLRPDVTFSDGTEFDAEDVKFSLERLTNPELACPAADGFNIPVTAEVVDPQTVVFTSEEPDPTLPLKLIFLEILPTGTDTESQTREPIGTGPYRVVEWDAGTRLTLEQVEDYWGEAPAFPTVEYVWRSENSVRASMIQAGEADIATGLGPADNVGEAGVPYPTSETIALRLDTHIAPLDDIRVREAVNAAIDRDGLIDALFEGIGEPASQIVTSDVIGFNPDIPVAEYDAGEARALIEEAAADGVPVETPITIVARTGMFPLVAETAEVLQASLAEIGLNVEIQMLETNAHQEHQLRPFPEDSGPRALLMMHGNQTGDAAGSSMLFYMTSDGPVSTGGTPELDALLQEAIAASGEERVELAQEAMAYEHENVRQFAPLVHVSAVIGLAPGIEYEPNIMTNDLLRLADIRPGT